MKRRLLPLPLLVALLAGCGGEKPAAEPARPVLTRVVGDAAGGGVVTYAGEVRSRYETPLAFRVPGKIAARLVDAGALVKPGDVLARLDPADNALTVASAEAQLALAEADARRYLELRGRNFVSQAALDAKDTALKAARAQAELARNQSAYTTLKAEQPGLVGLVAAEVGQVVTAGQTVFRVSRPDTPEVAISIPETRMAEVCAATGAQVTLWAENRASYRGRLRELSPVADPVTRTYAARIAILDADPRVLLGMTANVSFNRAAAGDAAHPLSIPLTAVFQQSSQPAVWVVGADQAVTLRPIKVASYGENAALVSGGLKAGERIVTAGVHKLTAGESIKPVDSQ